MTEAVETIRGQKLDSRFTLFDRLGAGGQGEVWVAHDGVRGIDVALKVVNPSDRHEEAWRTLEHEHSIASRLDHPNILKVFAPQRIGDKLVLPMELASGGDLRRLRGGGFLEIIPVLLELAQAMEHAHERGVIHRDLKPGNVLFDARGRVRLADFGVAKTTAEASLNDFGAAGSSSAPSRDPTTHGFSPFTASPAQLRGEPPTQADDIYGLGALAYELLSGYPPYYPRFEKKRAIAEPVPPLVPVRQIPPLLASLVMRMLQKDPKRRPRTMREVIDELDAALNDTLTFDFEKVSKAKTPAAAGAAAPPRAASRDGHRFGAGPIGTAAPSPGTGPTRAASASTAPGGATVEAANADSTESTPPVAALPSFFASSTSGMPSEEEIAGNLTVHLPPSQLPDAPRWSPTSGSGGNTNSADSSGSERRSNPDRRAQPRDDSAPVRIRPPKFASDLSGDTSNNTLAYPGPDAEQHSQATSGGTLRRSADALARIDAALERAAALAASAPPPSMPQPYVRASAARAAEGRTGRSHFVPSTSSDTVNDETVAMPPPDLASIPNAHPDLTSRNQVDDDAPFSLDVPQVTRQRDDVSTVRQHYSAADTAAVVAAARRLAADSAARTQRSTDSAARADAGPSPHTEESASAPPPAIASAAAAANAAAAAANASRRTHADNPHAPASYTTTGVGGPAALHPLTVSEFDPTPVHQPITASRTRTPMRHEPTATWGGIALDGLPRVARLEPIKPTRWPWVVAGVLVGAAAVIYFWLPRIDLDGLPPELSAVLAPIQAAISSDETPGATAQQGAAVDGNAAAANNATASSGTTRAAANDGNTISTTPGFTASEEQRLKTVRHTFDTRLAALESRGAGVWGGRDFALAKTRAAESTGARDAGNAKMAQERLATATKLLDNVESRAPQALSEQVATGEKALGSGQQEVAGQAFDLARRIDPSDRRAAEGQRRAQGLNGVLPLLADAKNAEASRDYARAAQDYSQALSIDPNNAAAKAGQARANAAFGDDNYSKAVGAGFAALGAGRLDEAKDLFVKARALKPNGAEAADGLRRVQASLSSRGFASVRQHAADLESQERWNDAEQVYEDVLRQDSSLAFAQEGKARAASRADLDVRLQQLIDRPDRLSAPGVREDARALVQTAEAQSPSGPVLQAQIARLQSLLPSFDRPVKLSLVSDNSTEVAIWSVGSFGTFARRDIQLRPGKYTVVGTRIGFRDVRREITVAPGQDSQTIKVTCSEPI
jgi:serine/threonine protein kinase/tetratricopeptide (TPR) repeat protein